MASVSQQQIDELRQLFEARLNQEGPPADIGSFHPFDLERLNDDGYLKRYLEHHDGDMKLSLQMVWDTLVWRKTFGANDLNEDNVPMAYIREGAFFPRGKDINGKTLLIFKTIKHKKGAKDSDGLKKCVVYWFDRLERAERNSQITVFFDMEGTGISNMDMDFTKYLISLLKLYYPNYLNYIVIYEMPWVLNAAFKVIKSLLPAKAVAKMKFLSKANLKEIVPLDQALRCWGGEDDYEFVFEPELRTVTAVNDSGVKKVTFAESDQINADSDSKSFTNMITLNPPINIAFSKNGNEVTSTFHIMNNDADLITFKIKTTSPEKFRVRPNIGILATGVSQMINVVIQQGYHSPPSFGSDKFLVMCMPLTNAEANAQELADLWKNTPSERIEQHRLRCAYQNTDLVKNGIMRQNSGDGDKQTLHISQSLSDLKDAHQQMRKEMKTLKSLVLVTLSVTLVILFSFGYFYQARSSPEVCLKE